MFDKDAWYGDVHTAAEAMVEAVIADGKTIEWNGTPFTAHRGDNARQVVERWHYERKLYQLKHGIISVRDL